LFQELLLLLQTKDISIKIMTTTTTATLNAEILRNLGTLAESDPTLFSKEEYFRSLDQAERDIAEGKGKTFHNIEDMNNWLNEL